MDVRKLRVAAKDRFSVCLLIIPTMEQSEVQAPRARGKDGISPITEKAVALHDYRPESSGSCMELIAGMIITVHVNDPSGWCYAETGNICGWVPQSFLMSLDEWNSQRAADSLPVSHPSDAFVPMVEFDDSQDNIPALRLPQSDAALLRPLKRLAPQLYAKLDASLPQMRPVLTDISNAGRILVSDIEYLLRCRTVRDKSTEAACGTLIKHVDKLIATANTGKPSSTAAELNNMLDFAAHLVDAALLRTPPRGIPASPAPKIENRGRIPPSPAHGEVDTSLDSDTTSQSPRNGQAAMSPSPIKEHTGMLQSPIRNVRPLHQTSLQLSPAARVTGNSAQNTDPDMGLTARPVSTLPVPGTWDPTLDEKDASSIVPESITAAVSPRASIPRVPGHLSVQDSSSMMLWPDVLLEVVQVAPLNAVPNVASANSHLLSVVAALIGYVHSYQASSAASSQQRLIDLVHSTLHHVRYILAYVIALQEPDTKIHVRVAELESLGGSGEKFFQSAMELYRATTFIEPHDSEEYRTTVLAKAAPLLAAGNASVVAIQGALEGMPPNILLQMHVPSHVHAECSIVQDTAAAQNSPVTTSGYSTGSSRTSRTTTHYKSGSLASIRTDATSESASTRISGADTEFDTASSLHSTAEKGLTQEDPDGVALADDFSRFLWTNRDDEPKMQQPFLETEGDVSSSTLQAPVTPLMKNAPLAELDMPSSLPTPRRVIRNDEGRILGGTLDGLVESMIVGDPAIDSLFVRSFFLCFRMFSTSTQLREALIRVFCDAPQHQEPQEVRTRTLQLLRIWVEHHWHVKHDYDQLEPLATFVAAANSPEDERIVRTLQSLLRRRERLGSGVQNVILQTHIDTENFRLRRFLKSPNGEIIPLYLSGNDALPDNLGDTTQMYSNAAHAREILPAPEPVVSKSLLAHLQANAQSPLRVNVLEFDPLELARQITILESRLYCSILPDEILFRSTPYYVGGDSENSGPFAAAPHVRRMSMVTTQLTNWMGECIISELNLKRRAQILKFFVRLGSASIALHNYNLLMAIQSALNSSTISRLKRTWRALPAKIATAAENQRRLVEPHRNFSAYRAKLRSVSGPAVPFLGFVLTDETFCRAGNPATRDGTINMVRYVKIGRIMSEMEHFQQPYNLAVVDEIQTFLSELLRTLESAQGQSNGAQAGDELYRRSLMLEPRRNHSPRKGSIASLASVILPTP